MCSSQALPEVRIDLAAFLAAGCMCVDLCVGHGAMRSVFILYTRKLHACVSLLPFGSDETSHAKRS